MAVRKKHTGELLLVLLLFFVYAGCALMLSVLGANSYSQTVAVLQEGYDQRSSVLYVAQKVHQNDIGGGVRVESYNQNDALVLTEQDTGRGYETWLFIQDGYLCEQTISAGATVIPNQAQKIMPMKEMTLALSEEGLLSVSLTTGTGQTHATSIALRSSGGAFNTGNNPPVSPDLQGEEAEAYGITVMIPAPAEGGEG